MNRILLLVSLALIFSIKNSSAGILVRMAGTYIGDVDESSETSKIETTDIHYDLTLGWKSSNGFAVAYSLATHSEEISSSSATTSTSYTIKKSSSGPTLGWVNKKENGFFILGSYFLNSQITSGVSNSNTTYDGSGYQFELGYKATIKRIGFGAHIAYKTFQYDEITVGSVTRSLGRKLTYTDVVPMIDIWLTFQ